MKRILTIFLTTVLVALLSATGAIAQETGDFRSSVNGDWSAVATWETFDGSSWVAASSAPNGSEMITVQGTDTVSVDVSVSITGTVAVEGEGPAAGGLLQVTGGSFTVADGGIYEHARDAGSVPIGTWDVGSTVLFTGILADEPANSGQSFHHLTWNNPGQVENINIGWDAYTLGGDLTVLHTNGKQFRMTSASDTPRVITINGSVIVNGENAEFTTTGSGSLADYDVTVMGNVEVTNGGFLSASRGSSGMAVWTILGDLIVTDGRLGDSEDHDQTRSFVFAGTEAQTITASNVSYDGTVYYEIASGSDVTVATGEFPVDSLTVQGALTLEGELVANGEVALDGGSMTVANGGTYNHAHDAGNIPVATWADGSTVLLTGIVTNDPGNGDQDFFNYTWNNPGQIENINIGWDGYTLRGNMTVLNTNGNQFRLTSAGDNTRMITIEGDVVVNGENAEFTTTGSGSLADYEVTVLGNLEVINGGFLSASRGSSGRAIWFLYGDLTVADAHLGDSDDHEQEKSFVFAADTTAEGAPSQNVSVTNISYDGPVHFFVSDSSGIYVDAGSDFLVDASLVNEGLVEVDADGQLAFGGQATYEHAQDGGTIPTSTWNEGSTALFTSIVTSGPGNASQDFFNLVIDSPGNIENNDFNMDGNIIHGDIDVLNTGTARIYLTNPDSFEDREITIMGDLYVDAGDGAFSTQGTGSGESSVTINHHGNITVDSGNFSIGRGSGPIVHWYMYEGDLIFNAGKTQNSNPRSGSAFIFTGKDSTQILDVSADVEISHLPFTVDTSATLDIRDSNFSGMSDNIELRSGGSLATSFAAGFEDNLSAENLSLSSEAGYILNGTVEQQTGFSLPLTVASLTIDNEAGVVQSRDITITDFIKLSAGIFDNTIGLTLGTNAEIILDGGSFLIPLDNSGEPLPLPEPPYAIGDTANYNGSFSLNTVLGDTKADAWFIEGTEGSAWEIVDDAADDDNRALQFSVVHSGDDWSSNQAVNEPITVAEGDGYRASIRVKADQDGRIVRFYAGMPASGNFERVRGMDTPESELTTEWQEFDFEFNATADHATNGLRLGTEFNVASNDGGTIFIDDAVLERIDAVSNEVVEEIPDNFSLEQNYPNPFNPTTNIQYNLPEQAHVSLKVYDITGREVAELVDNNMNAGSHTFEWDASNLASGVYLYRITAGSFTSVRKLTLMK